MAHIFDVGTRAWQPDEKEGWVASEVQEKLVDGDKVKLIFRLENGEVRVPASHGHCNLELPLYVEPRDPTRADDV